MGQVLLVAGVVEGSSSITTTLTNAFTSIQGDIMSTVSTALPIALGIAGVGIVVTFGVKFFKRFAK